MLNTTEIKYHNLEQGRTLNFTTSQITPTNYKGYNVTTYDFTGYTPNAPDSFSGMTNTTNFIGVNSFVTLANYTGVSSDHIVQQSLPLWLN
jgi:hypothetical protein